jgi:hypothetical protein
VPLQSLVPSKCLGIQGARSAPAGQRSAPLKGGVCVGTSDPSVPSSLRLHTRPGVHRSQRGDAVGPARSGRPYTHSVGVSAQDSQRAKVDSGSGAALAAPADSPAISSRYASSSSHHRRTISSLYSAQLLKSSINPNPPCEGGVDLRWDDPCRDSAFRPSGRSIHRTQAVFGPPAPSSRRGEVERTGPNGSILHRTASHIAANRGRLPALDVVAIRSRR